MRSFGYGSETEARGGEGRGGEVEYVERIVEVPEVVVEERVRHVPRVEVQERIVEVPKIVYREKVVEVPEIEYVEVPVERVVEVPEVREEVVIREVKVPQYVEKPVAKHVTVEVPVEVKRTIPVPVEHTTTYNLVMPVLKPKYRTVKVPVYIPRFIEVPIPAELLDTPIAEEADQLNAQVLALAQQEAPSLTELEALADKAKNTDLLSSIHTDNVEASVLDAFTRAKLIQSALTSGGGGGGSPSGHSGRGHHGTSPKHSIEAA